MRMAGSWWEKARHYRATDRCRRRRSEHHQTAVLPPSGHIDHHHHHQRQEQRHRRPIDVDQPQVRGHRRLPGGEPRRRGQRQQRTQQGVAHDAADPLWSAEQGSQQADEAPQVTGGMNRFIARCTGSSQWITVATPEAKTVNISVTRLARSMKHSRVANGGIVGTTFEASAGL
jgi:hypothetical protein